MTGYATDMCYCRTTAGYQNLSKDFNVFLVGDATLATFPSNSTPRFATNASMSFAAHRPVDHADLLGPVTPGTQRRPPADASEEDECTATTATLDPAAVPDGGRGRRRGCRVDPRRTSRAADDDKALVAITLDLEMSRNFPDLGRHALGLRERATSTPRRSGTRSRRAAASRRRAACSTASRSARSSSRRTSTGSRRSSQAGHPVGNHTYDHVNVLATRPEDIQFRFQRAPWLIEGRTPAEVIRDNIRLADRGDEDAARHRAGRLPHARRLRRRPARPARPAGDAPRSRGSTGSAACTRRIRSPRAGEGARRPRSTTASSGPRPAAQPFVYPDGLVEVPMSPISDIGAFRTGRWRLEWFLKAIRLGVDWAIEHRAVFDFLGHPSCLYVTDPEFRADRLDLRPGPQGRRPGRHRRPGYHRAAGSIKVTESPGLGMMLDRDVLQQCRVDARDN